MLEAYLVFCPHHFLLFIHPVVFFVHLAIVGHGRTPKVSAFTSATEAWPAATKRPAVILGLVTNAPTVFSRVVFALLEC
jgi:hypothetical protein